MKSRLTVISIILCMILVVAPLYTVFSYTKPTATERQSIQKMIDISKNCVEGYNRCKDHEAEARKEGDEDRAKRWKELADRWADLYFRTRRNAVKWVDEDWDIPKPPNTTVFYDNNCEGKYGWCGGSKTDIRVGICPADFSDGPDLIASTKIHEMKHAWQIHNCMSSNGGYWDDCTFWGHYSEWEAYCESEKAHDEGIVQLEDKHKKRISDKIKEHAKGAIDALFIPYALWEPGDKKELADTAVDLFFIVHNPTDNIQEVMVTVTDELGWPMIPPSFDPLVLQPEEETVDKVTVQIPAGEQPNTVNPIVVSSNYSTSDVLFITVSPTVDVVPGEKKSGLPESEVTVDFLVRNVGTAPDTFDIFIDNPLGWTTSLSSPTVTLAPLDEAFVYVDVTIESDPTTFTTNLIFCEAVAQSDPTMKDEANVPVESKGQDVTLLGITNPLFDPILDQVQPKVVAMNLGHVDSFFDVYYEIDLPGGDLLTSGSQSLSLSPGQDQEITFDPVDFTQSGAHTLRAYTQLEGDAEEDNNMTTLDFDVTISSKVREWILYTTP